MEVSCRPPLLLPPAVFGEPPGPWEGAPGSTRLSTSLSGELPLDDGGVPLGCEGGSSPGHESADSQVGLAIGPASLCRSALGLGEPRPSFAAIRAFSFVAFLLLGPPGDGRPLDSGLRGSGSPEASGAALSASVSVLGAGLARFPPLEL